MSRISPVPYIQTRDEEIARMTRLYRVFRTPLRKLRSLPSPSLSLHWWRKNTLELSYRLHVISMDETIKYIEKFLLITTLESIKSADDSSGERTFTFTLARGDDAHLIVSLKAIPQTIDENPEAKCRKVVIGQDTHTYTSPRYAIVCD